jgi:hypothetical protein
LQMIGGFRISRAIYVAAKLAIADLLVTAPQTAQELAQSTHTHAPSLYRVLRALASVGVFAEDEKGQFHLTPPAEYLRSDKPDGIAATIKVLGESWHWEVWGQLRESVQTGQAAFEQLHGQNFFEFSEQNPEFARKQGPSKTSISARASASVVKHYDFSNLHKIVDIGLLGGYGNTLIPLLKSNPHLQGVLFDLPSVIEGATPVIEAAGACDRIQLIQGNCLDSVPSGGDAYLLMFVLHNWDDLRAIQILQNCCDAMSENAKLLIVEMIMPKGNDPFVGKFIDLESLLITPGGSERTIEQYQILLQSAGLRMTRLIATDTANSIIEAIKA